MKIHFHASWALALFVLTSANAQVPAPLLGKWKVTLEGDKRLQEASLVITETGGSWKTAVATKAKRDTCNGLEAPIAVERKSDSEALVKLKFSEALRGCTDSSLNLTIAADGKVSGTLGKTPITLSRQQ